jgi:hypothetical protein
MLTTFRLVGIFAVIAIIVVIVVPKSKQSCPLSYIERKRD